jgi:hypothetical protein
MSRSSGFGKPLKGVATLSERITGNLSETITQNVGGGLVDLGNVQITGGTIDGVIVGANEPGPAVFTTLQTGSSDGTGYDVCFFGETAGDSACWHAQPGKWDIQGDLLVRDISDLANLRVAVNTISARNTDGNITLASNGVGLLNLYGGINQITNNTGSSGNVSFNTGFGNFSSSAAGTSIVSSGGTISLQTKNGNIDLTTGSDIVIQSISTGTSPQVTTVVVHGLKVGDVVTISGSNSVPNVNGSRVVTSVVNSAVFTITPGFSVTAPGTAGIIKQKKDILLNATNSVKIPTDIPLTLGTNSNVSIKTDGTHLTIQTNSPGNINISGVGTILDSNLVVNGLSTIINSSSIILKDPILTLGGQIPSIDDNKDRGVEYNYHTGVSPKLGFFGYDDSANVFTFIPDATNTGEVISGAPGNVVFNDGTFRNVTVTGATTGIVSVLTVEHLSIAGGQAVNPSNTVIVSFIRITSSGTSSGELLAPTTDGFQKYIMISGLAAGAIYNLNCQAGILLDPGSGSTAAKTVTFSSAGQSVYILWDNVVKTYVIVNAGACITALV